MQMLKLYSRFPWIPLEITYNEVLPFDVIFPLESWGKYGVGKEGRFEEK